jgi:hypothetical protein
LNVIETRRLAQRGRNRVADAAAMREIFGRCKKFHVPRGTIRVRGTICCSRRFVGAVGWEHAVLNISPQLSTMQCARAESSARDLLLDRRPRDLILTSR